MEKLFFAYMTDHPSLFYQRSKKTLTISFFVCIAFALPILPGVANDDLETKSEKTIPKKESNLLHTRNIKLQGLLKYESRLHPFSHMAGGTLTAANIRNILEIINPEISSVIEIRAAAEIGRSAIVKGVIPNKTKAESSRIAIWVVIREEITTESVEQNRKTRQNEQLDIIDSSRITIKRKHRWRITRRSTDTRNLKPISSLVEHSLSIKDVQEIVNNDKFKRHGIIFIRAWENDAIVKCDFVDLQNGNSFKLKKNGKWQIVEQGDFTPW